MSIKSPELWSNTHTSPAMFEEECDEEISLISSNSSVGYWAFYLVANTGLRWTKIHKRNQKIYIFQRGLNTGKVPSGERGIRKGHDRKYVQTVPNVLVVARREAEHIKCDVSEHDSPFTIFKSVSKYK